jgi:hypothetical protein
VSKKKHKHRFEAALPEPVLTVDEVNVLLARARLLNEPDIIALCEVALDGLAPHAMRSARSILKTKYMVQE